MPASFRLPMFWFFVLSLGVLTSSTALAQGPGQTIFDDLNSGFPSTQGFTLNGSATLNGTALELTSGQQFQAGSVFTTLPYSAQPMTTNFIFQITDPTADGFAFVIQDAGPNALGSSGGGVGYGLTPGYTVGPSIPDSLAFIFDLYNNPGQVSNTLRVVSGGSVTATASGTTAIDLSPLDLHSGHRFQVNITTVIPYAAPVSISVTIQDLDDTTKSFSTSFAVNNENTVWSTIAHVGFTAATGSNTSTVKILGWNLTADQATYCGEQACLTYDFPTFAAGFADAQSTIPPSLQLNNEARIAGSSIDLTNDSTFEANSAFSIYGQPTDTFSSDFDFNLGPASAANEGGDGFAFVLAQSPTAVGASGEGLGYEGIPDSVAIKFDMHNNAGETDNSTGFYLNGVAPTVPAIIIPENEIDFHSGHTFHAHVYYGYGLTSSTKQLTITLTDLTSYSTFQTTIPITTAIPYGYPGFTAGTGAEANTIQILNWTWSSD